VTLFGFQALDRAARQSPDEAPADPKDDRGTPLSRRGMAKRLSTARRLIDEQRYAEAIAQIQRVLDNPQDEYCAVPGLRSREQSGKLLAEELLLSLPEEAQDIYEKQNGPAAQRLLEKTLKEFGNLDQVVDRYLHTRAGSRALYRQSVDAWERGQPLLAAQGFERLRQRGFESRELEPMLTLRAVAAWSQAGDMDRARRLFSEFAATNSGANLQVGGQKLTVPKSGELPVWLAQRERSGGNPQQDVSENWLTWRGNSHRNGLGTGGGPYLNHGWRVETLASLARDTKEGRLVDILSELSDLARLDNEATPAISVGSPLVVGNLVIFRSLYNLRAVDRVTGNPVWTNAERDNDIFELLRPGPGGLPQSNQTMGTPAEYVVAQRLWSDINYNAISSDGERVYAVEDLGFVVPALPARIGPSQAVHNRLMAYDARSGRMLWEAGAPREPAGDALAGVFFLGAPVAWQGLLYAIVDLGSSPHLAVFQAKTGKLDVLQPLGSDEVELTWVDRARLTSGLTPSTDGGVLLCPTGPDSVTAYDPGRRRLMWRYRFRPRTEAPGPRGQLQLMQQQMARGASRLPEQSGWIDYAGIIDSGRAIYSPKDSDELFCLNVNDGTLAWKAARGGGLYVGGIRDGVVLVVGRNFIQGLRLDDGRPAWTSPTMLPVVTGRGCLSDQSYLVPLASGEVAAVNVDDGHW
ncbi:MAG: PQQ-binding-like beta-propeller repeat protein, partial [Planctomycetota bacterium]|nr:PQQ-binding-like beta-propeller repeat protein [Planctomycetota bacterium]